LKGNAKLNLVQEGERAGPGASFGAFSSRLTCGLADLPSFTRYGVGMAAVADAPGYPAACRCCRVVV